MNRRLSIALALALLLASAFGASRATAFAIEAYGLARRARSAM